MRTLLMMLLLGLAACSPMAPASEDDAVQAPASVAETSVPMPPTTAMLRGRVSYPSEELPEMRVCAIDPADPGRGYCTKTAANEPHYELIVPPGAWWLLAWPQDTGAAGDPGLLSVASECLATGGLDCDDHALRPIAAPVGTVTEGLDINDWYYDPRETPPPMEPRGETPPE
ncbi:hypothetical protein [Arenimonas daejeonensis]|uniref:hypothetical protein n=1 Tax=Arenimonas daejeonensis TaxID=370777 RepID=UPI0011BFD7F4|nr:hypothetical protein [Arenimonas daejeonensis]